MTTACLSAAPATLAEVMYAPLLFDTKLYFIVFGLVMILGGIMGYVKAKSMASLIAGGASGVLLIIGALLIPRLWQGGVALGLLVSLALAGRFIPALLRGKYNPAGYVVPLAVIGAVLAAVVLFTVVHA